MRMAMDSSKKGLIEQLVGILPDWLGWLFVPLTFGYFLWRLWLKREWELLGNPGNPAFPDRIQRLREKSIAESYRARLNQLLILVSRAFGPEGVAREGSPGDKLFGCQPWTPLAFERLLLLAVAYPVLFLLIGGVTSEKVGLGNFVILEPPKMIPVAIRLLVMGLSLYLFLRVADTPGWRRVTWVLVVGVTSFVVGAFAGPYLLIVGFVTCILLIGFDHVAANVSAVFAAAAVYAVVSAVNIPVFHHGNLGAAVIILTFPIAFGFATRCLVSHARHRAEVKDQLAFFWKSGWCVLVICIVFPFFWVVESGIERNRIDHSLIILMLLGILPLFNAPLDWLSFGVTRGLLRAIATGAHGWALSLLLAAFDLLLALLFLLAVAASTLAGIWAVNLIAEAAGYGPVVGLQALFQQLKSGGWEENLWIWLMLGSTLIPTAVHFLVALYALALVFPAKKARWAALHMKKARNDWLRRDGEAETTGNPGDVQVHEDARRYAFFHLLLGQTLVTGFWLVSVGGFSYLLFTHLPGWVQAGLDLLRPIITNQAV